MDFSHGVMVIEFPLMVMLVMDAPNVELVLCEVWVGWLVCLPI